MNHFEGLAIVDGGWIYHCYDIEITPLWVIFHKAAVVEYWGTTQGLGELQDGPLPETRLSKANTKTIAIGRVTGFEYCKWPKDAYKR